MSLRYYMEISRTECIESTYFWYFPNSYKCVDARYIGINFNRGYALRELEAFVYKMIYLNPSASMGAIVDAGIEKLNDLKKYKGVFISEYDIHHMVKNCFDKDFSNNMMDMIYEYKKILWKNDLSSLFAMNEEEKKEYDDLVGIKRKKYYRDFKSKKKRAELLSFLNKIKSMNKRDLIIEAIKLINEEKNGDGYCSISDVVSKTKISFNVVKKHYENYVGKSIKMNGYDLVVNKNEINKEEKIQEIQSAINEMKLNGEKINKKTVAEKSGVSRTTVIKHWDKLIK